MSKYDPLRDFLKCQARAELTLTFRDIERIIADFLPTSAETSHWWGNVKRVDAMQLQRNVQCNAWREAGYDAHLVRGAQRVQFRRSA